MPTPNLFNFLSEEEFINQFGQLNSNVRHQNALLEVMAAEQLAQVTENFDEIVELVEDGLAPDVLHIGSQINLEWTDVASNTKYIVPHDIRGRRAGRRRDPPQQHVPVLALLHAVRHSV